MARAEAGLAALGFRAMRVRHYGDLARVELPMVDLERAVGPAGSKSCGPSGQQGTVT